MLNCAITNLKQMENRKPQKRRSYKEEPKENFRIEKYNILVAFDNRIKGTKERISELKD